MTKSGRKIAKKHGMRVAGIGGGAVDGITSMSVSFDRWGPLMSREMARKLSVECIDQFVENVNEDHAVRQYLSIYPFPRDMVSIYIFNRDEVGGEVYDPAITVIIIGNGKIK